MIHTTYVYGKEYSQCCELRPAACRPHQRLPSRALQKLPAPLHAPGQPAYHFTPNLIRYTVYTGEEYSQCCEFAQQHVSLVSTCHLPLCICRSWRWQVPMRLTCRRLHIITHPISHLLHAHMHWYKHSSAACMLLHSQSVICFEHTCIYAYIGAHNHLRSAQPISHD